MNFLVIKNEKLRKVLEGSASFKQFSSAEQKDFLRLLNDLPAEQQKEMCEFFIKSNQSEKKKSQEEEEKLIANLEQFVEQVEDATLKFKKVLITQKEDDSRGPEIEQQQQILEEIDKI